MKVLAEQHVARLDVTVDDAKRMDVVEGRRHVLEPEIDEILVDVRLVDVLDRMGLAVIVEDEIHDEVRHLRLRLDRQVEDPNDVRMLEPGERAPLVQELLAQEVRLLVVAGERLQRVVRAKLDMLNLVHVAHPALSERTDDLVRADAIAGFEDHDLDR